MKSLEIKRKKFGRKSKTNKTPRKKGRKTPSRQYWKARMNSTPRITSIDRMKQRRMI